MNRPKQKGTAFETACVKALREGLEDDRIERRALHGSKDMGDIYGIRIHMTTAIAECKAYKRVTPGLIAQWREQTLIEKGNAETEVALLIVKVPRAPILQSQVHVTVSDYMWMAGSVSLPGDWADERWVQITLAEAIDLIKFGASQEVAYD